MHPARNPFGRGAALGRIDLPVQRNYAAQHTNFERKSLEVGVFDERGFDLDQQRHLIIGLVLLDTGSDAGAPAADGIP